MTMHVRHSFSLVSGNFTSNPEVAALGRTILKWALQGFVLLGLARAFMVWYYASSKLTYTPNICLSFI